MNVVLRVDASLTIGAGHVMRCLTLASALRECGATSLFICRKHEGHLCDEIQERGFAVRQMPARNVGLPIEDAPRHASWLGVSWQQDAEDTIANIESTGVRPDWIIADHYAIDHRWEKALRKHVGRIAVIDDLADRIHDCDLLLDQNCISRPSSRYNALVPDGCEKLVGPKFALLRPEFRNAREKRRRLDGVIQRILIFFGTVDAHNYTSDAISALRGREWSSFQVDVVIGATNPWREDIRKLCGLEPQYGFHCQAPNMADLMAEADLAVSAGGFTSYELAYMGLPALLFPLTQIQEEVSAEITACGAAISLGRTVQFPRADFVRLLGELSRSPTRCMEMAQSGRLLFDGRGAERVADALTRKV